jgi:hypothetical protein
MGFAAFDSAIAILLIKHGGYWLLLLTWLLLLVNLYQRTQTIEAPLRCLRKLWSLPAGYVLVCSVLLLTMQPSGYKITMDEPVLAATSLQMHMEREVMTAARAYEVNGVFSLLGGYVDKRPYFFPFLASLLHDLTGYRALQGVLLNGLLTPLFLSLLFIAGRLIWRDWGGYLLIGLFMTVPLLAMNVNGAGFELLNLVMILGTSLAAYSYLQCPAPRKMDTLILMGLLLAQTRYESVLYVLAVGCVIAVVWMRRKEIEFTWIGITAPLLLISFPLQQIIFDDYESLWQLDHNDVDRPFSLDFVFSNLWRAGRYFFAMNRHQPNSLLLSFLFVAACAGFVYAFARRRVRLDFSRNEAVICYTFGFVIFANFSILMAYHWGQIDDIVATRLVLPFLLFQAVAVVFFLSLFQKCKHCGCLFFSVVLIFFISVTRPLCARSDFLMWGTTQAEVLWLQEKARLRQGQSVLFITNRHLVPIAEQVSAAPIHDALSGKAQLDLHQRLKTFSEVLIVYVSPFSEGQHKNYNLGDAAQIEAALNAAFEMETLEEEKLNDGACIRLARLKRVHLDDSERLELNVEEQTALRNGSAYREFSKSLP